MMSSQSGYGVQFPTLLVVSRGQYQCKGRRTCEHFSLPFSFKLYPPLHLLLLSLQVAYRRDMIRSSRRDFGLRSESVAVDLSFFVNQQFHWPNSSFQEVQGSRWSAGTYRVEKRLNMSLEWLPIQVKRRRRAHRRASIEHGVE